MIASAQGDRPDLAAMVGRLSRTLITMEQPVLAAHGVSMWGYVVLTSLDEAPLRTQAALARTVGADKTRIIGVLDDLQERGLISREPDPTDRRVRLLALTPAGRRLHAAVRQEIRRHEEELLARLPIGDREGLLRALRALDAQDDQHGRAGAARPARGARQQPAVVDAEDAAGQDRPRSTRRDT